MRFKAKFSAINILKSRPPYMLRKCMELYCIIKIYIICFMESRDGIQLLSDLIIYIYNFTCYPLETPSGANILLTI